MAEMQEVKERMIALESEVTQVKASMAVQEAVFEKQKKDLIDYVEKEFATSKLAMNEIIEAARAEFGTQRLHLQSLYEGTAQELVAMKERVDRMSSGTGGPGGKEQGKLIEPKQMVPRMLDKQEDWKLWRSEVEDYCEVVKEGMKEALEAVKGQKEEK